MTQSNRSASHLLLIYLFVVYAINSSVAAIRRRNFFPSPRILKGELAQPGQFPYQIALIDRFRDLNVCGGSIIGPQRVLTAAHCVSDFNRKLPKRQFAVLAGTNDVWLADSPPAVFSLIERISIHPKRDAMRFRYDYAILITVKRLYEPNETNAATAPIALSWRPVADGTACVVSGWGITEQGTAARRLMYANVTKLRGKECARLYERAVWTRDLLCAVGMNGQDAAPGDSGGPLVCGDRLVGVVSYGPRYASMNLPGVYARVDAEREWIVNVGGLGAVQRVWSVYLLMGGLWWCMMVNLLRFVG